jgi:hypothetical protein
VKPAPGWEPVYEVRPPLPPADFATRTVPIDVVEPGTILFRIHRPEFEPMFFGPVAGSPPQGRWDAPEHEFGVCYLAARTYVAFAKTFLRVPGIVAIGEADLRSRAMARVRALRPIRLVAFHGSGLVRMGGSASICSGPHEPARTWSRVLHAHPSAPDGIAYRARHDDDGFALALYDRAADSVEVLSSEGLLHEEIASETGRMMDRYELALD